MSLTLELNVANPGPPGEIFEQKTRDELRALLGVIQKDKKIIILKLSEIR